MLKLCGFRISNYHNKVRLVLLEKGIEHEEDASCTPKQSEEYLARSPMGKVPFLEVEDGGRLTE
jgi:glutathione S-transferase